MGIPRVGYVGLGVTGGTLGRRLLREHRLAVFDLSSDRRTEFAALGATVVESPAVGLTCLPTAAREKDVIFGDIHDMPRFYEESAGVKIGKAAACD